MGNDSQCVASPAYNGEVRIVEEQAERKRAMISDTAAVPANSDILRRCGNNGGISAFDGILCGCARGGGEERIRETMQNIVALSRCPQSGIFRCLRVY